jgi:hypothetical protein
MDKDLFVIWTKDLKVCFLQNVTRMWLILNEICNGIIIMNEGEGGCDMRESDCHVD